MRDIITSALKGKVADYIEIRVEERVTTRLSFRGRELEEVSTTADLGGNVRALVKGGWGFATFNDTSSLAEKVDLAVAHARAVGSESSKFASVPPIVDVVPLQVKKDPRSVSLAEKKRALDDYTQLLWSVSPKIQTTRSNYGDLYRKLYFANTDGAYIEEEKVDMTASFAVMAREGDNVQQGLHSTGSADDYGFFERLHDDLTAAARRAVGLLSAKPVKGGEYPVVLDPKLSGVFAHEAFGHLSEADHVFENPRLQELLVMGKKIATPVLSIYDGASAGPPGLRGSFKYDSEGTPAQKTYLIKDGFLVGRLHSRETAAEMKEQPTGNARAISYRFPPIVRMTNTGIEPGNVSFDEMIGDIKEGVYAKGSFGGETALEMFTFSAEEGFMIRNGKIEEPVRGVLLSGNVFNTLLEIDAIGNDLYAHNGGGCGKGGQMPLPVSMVSPHIRIRKCVVGGR